MKTALELFNHRYSEDERFSWLEMIDFAEAYASQSKEECANYARSKAVTDGEIEDAFPMKYSEAVGSAHNILQLARRSGAKWMREQQGEGAKEDYVMDLINFASALDNYIKFLGYELDETAVLAHAHGWRSGRVKEGERLRAELKQLKEKAGLTDKQ